MSREPDLTRVERHFVAYAAEHTGTWWTRWAYRRAWIGAGLFLATLVTLLILRRSHPALELAILASMLLVIEGMFTFLMQLCGKLWRARGGEEHESTAPRTPEAQAEANAAEENEGDGEADGAGEGDGEKGAPSQ